MKEKTIPFWAQPTSKLEFHSTEEQKVKEETMEESLDLGKKSQHRNRYRNSILVWVAKTETRFRSYTIQNFPSPKSCAFAYIGV